MFIRSARQKRNQRAGKRVQVDQERSASAMSRLIPPSPPVGTSPTVRRRYEIPSSRLLSTRQAAEYLGISATSIRRYIADGLIPFHKVGPKLIKVDPADLDAFARKASVNA